MITFIISLIALVVGFVLYGTFVERVFGINEKAQTPAVTKADGVDFVPMKPWRIFLVQFLNIAGLGPIFGAIMAKRGRCSTIRLMWLELRIITLPRL